LRPLCNTNLARARMRVRVCVCACACMCVRVCVRMMRMCAGVRVFYAWVCASRVSFPAHWAH